MAIDESNLKAGEVRKLDALKKSVGDKIGERAFMDWKNAQPAIAAAAIDKNAVKLEEALAHLVNDKSFKLGNKGYTVRKAKGKGASGFVAKRNE